jgi:hypothetical protein
MPRSPRSFMAEPARRTATPLFIGLFGPSSSGKTYSALELATGIQSVVGGEIVGIDTENRRMLHYADHFKFKHIDFQPPFGSLDYRDALRAAEALGAKTIIIDSMSHEHEGPGGMIELHEQIVQRMSGGDFRKAERVKMLAWNEPKQHRRALLNALVRTNLNVICCWRAKTTAKPKKNAEGKQEVVNMGFTPIGGDEFVFEMTVAAFLPPGAHGIPNWHPENEGERQMVKLPGDHQWLADRAAKGRPLDRASGAGLAKWAQGTPSDTPQPRQQPQETQEREEPPQREPEPPPRDPEPPQGHQDDYGGDGYEGV